MALAPLGSVSQKPCPNLVPSFLHVFTAVADQMTAREVAEQLRVSTATVYRLCERGEIEHVRVSNAVRVSREALRRYLGRG